MQTIEHFQRIFADLLTRDRVFLTRNDGQS
ncbi:Uncharacterised protein [Vibrio cholerae]|nr:Uncharacterised protein [Vibrio cholerae]CSD18296.1 Uncharacterised protein [Vibrio cholerae]